jgi:hypothetical protein
MDIRLQFHNLEFMLGKAISPNSIVLSPYFSMKLPLNSFLLLLFTQYGVTVPAPVSVDEVNIVTQ